MQVEHNPNFFGNENFWMKAGTSGTFFDTGVDRQSYIQCEIDIDAAGTLTAVAGSKTIIEGGLLSNPGGVLQLLSGSLTDVFSSGASKTQKSMLLDDYEVDILDL